MRSSMSIAVSLRRVLRGMSESSPYTNHQLGLTGGGARHSSYYLSKRYRLADYVESGIVGLSKGIGRTRNCKGFGS